MSRHNSRSGLFLMEMIIVILFFSVCAAICVNVFAKARVTADDARALNTAATRSSNIAEAYKAAAGDLNMTAELMDEASDDDLISVEADKASGSLTLIYDDMTIIIREDADEGGFTDIKAYDRAHATGSDHAADASAEIFEIRARA